MLLICNEHSLRRKSHYDIEVRFRPLLLALFALATAAACGSQAKNGDFEDSFDGTKFPEHGWLFGGQHPVLYTSAGNAAPSLSWTSACAGSNGAVVQVDQIFDSAHSFDGQIDFFVYGTAQSAATGTAFHIYGDYGDDAAVILYPPPAAEMQFELDGDIIGAAIPVGEWHHLEFAVDQFGEAGWAFDDQVVNVIGPFRSVEYVAEIDCASGLGDQGPVPVLFDNIAIHSRP